MSGNKPREPSESLDKSLGVVIREVERLKKSDELLGEIIATFSLEQNRKWMKGSCSELLDMADRWINRYNGIR